MALHYDVLCEIYQHLDDDTKYACSHVFDVQQVSQKTRALHMLQNKTLKSRKGLLQHSLSSLELEPMIQYLFSIRWGHIKSEHAQDCIRAFLNVHLRNEEYRYNNFMSLIA